MSRKATNFQYKIYASIIVLKNISQLDLRIQ